MPQEPIAKSKKKTARAKQPNNLLREARKQSFLTQSQVAEKIGTTVVNVNRWEQGVTFPTLYFQGKLCELFQKTPEELGLVPVSSFPAIWNVPFRRNVFFTGREDVLERLHQALNKEKVITLAQAISGLGGIGKTQTAVEYAFRYKHEHKAIFWTKADSRSILTADFVHLASLLNLPEANESDQYIIVDAVKQWLKEQSGWLLILDNVEDIGIVDDFVPPVDHGRILLTTRLQATGSVAQRVEMDKMRPEEGALFLLRRIQVIEQHGTLGQAQPATQENALELSRVLDGLPLALDQAAAYIEETGCGLAGYLVRFETRSKDLLDKRGEASTDHPQSVVATFSLSFEKVQQMHPGAADLLRFIAFLHPDAIPEELVINREPEVGKALAPLTRDLLELDAAIKALRTYSLVRRDSEARSLQVHRLVQEVLKDTMDEKTQHLWAERATRTVQKVFPPVEFPNWQLCQRYILHAQKSSELIKQYGLAFPEAMKLLDQAGLYLYERAQYAQAEALFNQALALYERSLPSNSLDKALCLNHLAKLYWARGKFTLAESLHKQVLEDRINVLGPQHPAVADSLNNLAILYDDQGRLDEAEQLYSQALAIFEKVLGPDHPEVARSLNNLGWLYFNRGEYERAELYYIRAQGIIEKTEGADSPKLAYLLSNRSAIYMTQERYAEAQPIVIRALAICKNSLGSDHPHTALLMNNLGNCYYVEGSYEQAEHHYQEALGIRRKILGPDHTSVAQSLTSLATLYTTQRKYAEAEALFQQALGIYERANISIHVDIAEILENYAGLLREMKREQEAASLVARAKPMWEKIKRKENT